jgi:hypothetical protein
MKKVFILICLTLLGKVSYGQSYLPLTGGTLTGTLYGTNASFSGSMNSAFYTAGASQGDKYGCYFTGVTNTFHGLSIKGNELALVVPQDGVHDFGFYGRSAGNADNRVAYITDAGAAYFSSTISNSIAYQSAPPSISSVWITRQNHGGAVSLWTGGYGYNGMWLQAIQDDGSNNLKNLMLNPMGGYVGINTNHPGYQFDVNGAGNFSGTLNGTSAIFSGNTYHDWGAVSGGGIQIYDDGNAHIERNAAGVIRIGSNNTSDIYLAQGGGNLIFGSSYNQFTVNPSGAATFASTITATGVSINGNIKTKKLIVTQSGWSDYVFYRKYRLRPLLEIEQFIKINKHLPDVPDAKEVAKEGVDIGATEALLLKKIEELTLYMIEMKKENQRMQSEINELKKKKIISK